MQASRQSIRDILEETYQLHGWDIPQYVIRYQAELLASYIDQVNWRPEPSYAECYLQIRTCEQALHLGNVCWFTRAVFPELGERRGIRASYYVDMGTSCYDRVIVEERASTPTIEIMRDHFEFLAECAHTAIRYHGHWRSMWD